MMQEAAMPELSSSERDRLHNYARQCEQWAVRARSEGHPRLASIFRAQAAQHRRRAAQLMLEVA